MATILLIDNDPNILRLLEKLLKQENYQVLTAINLEEASFHLKKKTPDLVITDLTISSSTSSFEVLKMFNRRTCPPPVIVMTANTESFPEEEARRLGVSAYFPKPFDIERMITTVNRLAGVACHE